MFLIGILSTPLFYMLAAFTYLLVMSFGVFSKTDDVIVENSDSGNLKNFEILTPESDIQEEFSCNFLDFLDKTGPCDEIISEQMPATTTWKFCFISPPDVHIKYLNQYIDNCLFNRPPPAFA